jgi:hypothetical protein
MTSPTPTVSMTSVGRCAAIVAIFATLALKDACYIVRMG